MEQSTKPKRTRAESGALLFFTCWACYFCAYLGRYNLYAVLPSLISEGVVDKITSGLMGSAFFLCYGVGHFLNGFLGDRFSPRKMIFVGLSISGLCNFAMAFLSQPVFLIVAWGVNGYAQSMLWGPLIRLLSLWMDKTKARKAVVNLQTSMFAGTIVAYAGTALLLAISDWRMVFRLVGGIMLVVVAVSQMVFMWWEQTYHSPELPNQEIANNRPLVPEKKQSFWQVIFSSGLLLITLSVMMCGILKDGISVWLPTFMREQFALSEQKSVLAVTIIPLINMIGMYGFTTLNKRLGQDEVKTSMICFGTGVAAYLALLVFGGNLVMTVLAFSVASAAMFGINTLFLALLPIRFLKKGMISSVAGVLDSASYLASAVASFGIGVLSEKYGWNMLVVVWMCVAAVGILALLLVYKKWHRYREAELD